MKRFIAILLVMGVIMTAFAETAVVPDNAGTVAAQTNVVLDLNQNLAVVWFSKGNEPTTWYTLTLPATLEQGTTTWVAEGQDLYLNWNIISKDNVDIILSIDSPMKSSTGKEVGWYVSFTTAYASGSDGSSFELKEESSSASAVAPEESEESSSASAVALEESEEPAEEPAASPNEHVAFSKDTATYGNHGSLPISIRTEDIYGKDALVYTAIITATVKTTT